MKTQKNNKLIAEFMNEEIGFSDTSEPCVLGDYSQRPMKYHKSWDWLMPVLEKINYKVADTWKIIQIGIGTKYVDVTNFNTSDLFYYNTGNNLEDTYNCCIDVIKALNNNEI